MSQRVIIEERRRLVYKITPLARRLRLARGVIWCGGVAGWQYRAATATVTRYLGRRAGRHCRLAEGARKQARIDIHTLQDINAPVRGNR